MAEEIRFRRKIGLFFLGFICHTSHTFAGGGISTDGTLGQPARIISAPNSLADVEIKQNEGATLGRNLFHSFAKFNIESGQTVTFTENTTNALDNVISRVTGGSSSEIYGTLSSTPKGHANFYLINPSGITFGPGGKIVDVPGSIHISTADQLKFKDGKIFSAVNPSGNSLSSAAPAAFGFLGTSKVNNGLLKIDSAEISIKENKVFDAVAGEMIFSHKDGTDVIRGQKGEVRLIARQDKGEISVIAKNNNILSLPDLKPTTANAGDIQINNASITTFGDGGGRISIWGKDLTISDYGALNVVNNGSANPEKEKGISIRTKSMLLKGGSLNSDNFSFSSVKSADINIKTEEDLVLENGVIAIASSGTNNTGNIDIKSGNVTINNDSLIITDIQLEGKSSGGNISIKTAHGISLLKGGRIKTTHSGGGGILGNVKLYSGNDITVNGKSEFNPSGIFADTKKDAKAGDITVESKGNINLLNGGQIDNSTSGSGKGGIIKLNGRKILLDNASISAASKTRSSGAPGNIKVIANESLDLNRGIISIENSSETTKVSNIEKVSQIYVSAAKINLKDDSQITTQATGNAPAGAIAIDFANALCLNSSFISTESKEGNGGALSTKGGTLIDLKNSGFKTTVSGEKGNGGDINVTADNLVMETGLIQANTAAKQAKGGNINFKVKALIPSGNQLTVGGNEPITWQPGIFGFNVIQAAARFGLSGTIQSTAPILNLSGTLANLGSPKFDSRPLNPSYCSLSIGSSLTRLGKGGLHFKARDSWVY